MSRIDTNARLAALLVGWLEVWRDVLGAVATRRTSPIATAELRGPAAQAMAWLRSDLAFLTGADCGEPGGEPLPPGELVERLADPAAAWGAAYVLRGSRLGGTLIAPAVRTALSLRTELGTSFLASAGTDPGREWVAFRRRMDDVAMTTLELNTTVDAARWTFAWVGGRISVACRPRLVVTA